MICLVTANTFNPGHPGHFLPRLPMLSSVSNNSVAQYQNWFPLAELASLLCPLLLRTLAKHWIRAVIVPPLGRRYSIG